MSDKQTTNKTSGITKIVIVSYCLAMGILSGTFRYVVDHNITVFASLVIVLFSILLTVVLALTSRKEADGG